MRPRAATNAPVCARPALWLPTFCRARAKPWPIVFLTIAKIVKIVVLMKPQKHKLIN
jgi:hypothetical protein